MLQLKFMMYWEMRLQSLVNEEKSIGTYEIDLECRDSFQAEFTSTDYRQVLLLRLRRWC